METHGGERGGYGGGCWQRGCWIAGAARGHCGTAKCAKRKTSYGSAGASPYRRGTLNQASTFGRNCPLSPSRAGSEAAVSAGLADDGQAIQAG